jgi:hypothetical protein
MFEKMQSEQINELALALSKVQGELTPAVKDSKNPFFKSSYADLSSVWNSCKEALSKNGLAIIQTMDVKDGQYMLVTTLAHGSGQWMRSLLPILNEKGNAQGLGSAITYMRRYALSAIVGVTCDEDDDGNEASRPLAKNPANGKANLITKEQAEEIKAMLEQCDDIYSNRVVEHYAKIGIHDWKGLTVDQYRTLHTNILRKIKGEVA